MIFEIAIFEKTELDMFMQYFIRNYISVKKALFWLICLRYLV